MTQMQFAKYQALGNDYLVVERDDVAERLSPSVVRRICDRHFGIGADGILVREPSSDPTEFRLRILNPDGRERGAGYTLASGSSSCASAAVAKRLGLCDSSITVHMPGGSLAIEVDDNFFVRMTGPVGKVAEGRLSDEVLMRRSSDG